MVFNQIVDHLKNILIERFKSFKNVVDKFRVLTPDVLKNKDISNMEIREMATELCNLYNKDLDASLFPRELVMFRFQNG